MVEKYILKCNRDNFSRIGTIVDFSDLISYGGCKSCDGHKYKCPKCGYLIKARKILVKEDVTQKKDV